MRKLLLTLTSLLVFVLVLCLVGCGETPDTSTESSSEENETTTQTLATVTTDTTAIQLTDKGVPVSKLTEVSELVGTHKFGEEGLALMKLFIRDYYDTRSNRVLNANGNQITLWAVGSFLEAVGSVYKMYPDDEEIKSVYTGLLDRGVAQYKVRYVNKKVNGVVPYYYNASAGNQGDYYYDDDEWIAIQYLEAYKNLGDAKYLTKAQEILEFIWLGWGINTKEEDNLGMGGIPWKVGTGPLTCSNAPAAYAFAMFSMLTENEALSEEYLNRAITVYDWVYKYLRNGSLYKDGPGNNWSGSYNNGLMIASGSLLYSITGEAKYLTQVRNTARAAYSNNFTTTSDKKIKFENDIDNYWMDAWLVKGYIEYYKIDKKNENGYLDDCCEIMAFALENKLNSGYLCNRLDETPDFTWSNDNGNYTNNSPSTDPTVIGGGVSLLMILADWANLYGENYQ